MKTYGLYESASVKVQTIKTAIEVRGPNLTRAKPLRPSSDGWLVLRPYLMY